VCSHSRSRLHSRSLPSQVLLGTAYLHANRIVHRDLKPENIIYKTKALDSPLVIADFGIAKSLEDVAAAAEVARSREGSPTTESASAPTTATPGAGPSTASATTSSSSTSSPVHAAPAHWPTQPHAQPAEEGEELTCMAGSFGYVAPEVLMGTGHGMKVDMWSIG
jgi:serine/threonine protein kinase